MISASAPALPRRAWLGRCLHGWTEREHVRYLGSGAICALINNAVFIGGAQLGYSNVTLTLVSAFTSGTIGYGLHVKYSFRAHASWRGWAQFLGGTAVGIPLTIATLDVLAGMLHLPMWIAAPATTALMLVYNYAIARLAILGRLIGRRMVVRST